jgi:ADP-ribose pyrophosphatase YjhB (NUDIX family)
VNRGETINEALDREAPEFKQFSVEVGYLQKRYAASKKKRTRWITTICWFFS